MDTLVVTGAAGRIGRVLREGLRGEATLLRLADRAPLPDAGEGEEVVAVDLLDLGATEELLAGADAVVHLAAIPHEAGFEGLVDNVRTTGHVLEAARRQRVRRVVLASSNHVTGFYATDELVGPDDPPRPDTFYGVSKLTAEGLGRLYVDKFGLEVACLRIGTFGERPGARRQLATWLSPRDTVQLVRCCLRAPLSFVVVYGVSGTRRGYWDTSTAEALGYRPEDDAEAYAGEVADDEPGSSPARHAHLQGGEFCAPETTVFAPSG